MSFILVLVMTLLAPGYLAQNTQATELAQVEPITKKLIDAFRSGDAPAMKPLFADSVLFVGDLSFLGDPKGTRGQRDVTRDQLTSSYTALFDAIGREKWTALLKDIKQTLVRATQGGHPDDSKGELPKGFVRPGDYVFQLSLPGSGLDDVILFVLRPAAAGKWQIVAHWADY